MTTLREAAQMALEAMEQVQEADTAGATPKMVMEARKLYEPTITALRAALAQHEPWVKTYSGGKPNYTEPCERCGEVNPAEIHTCTPKQREMNKDEYIKFLESACRDIYEVWAGSEGIPMPETAPEGYLLFLVEQMRDIAKRALAQPEQEPQGGYRWREGDVPPSMTYTAPPQREWQGLTNDEIDDIWAEFNDGYSIIEETLWGYERAIEAKIREKNA